MAGLNILQNYSTLLLLIISCRYRKIGGDVCTGGSEVSYQAVEVPCCKGKSHPVTPPNCLHPYCCVGFISSSDTVSILLGVFLAITLAVIVAQFGVIVVILL